ncbi:hypothetical protein [Nocardia sp. NPDC004722]
MITSRPLDCRTTEVLLVAQRRKSTVPPHAARTLHEVLVRRAVSLGTRAA